MSWQKLLHIVLIFKGYEEFTCFQMGLFEYLIGTF